MFKNLMRISIFLFVVMPGSIPAQNIGTAPTSKLDVVDPYTTFQVTPLKDTPDSSLYAAAGELQAGMRARELGISGHAPIDAWQAAETLLQISQTPPQDVPVAEVFQGATAASLNNLLANGKVLHVRVQSPVLTVDQPVVLLRNGITLDLGDSQLVSAMVSPYMIRIEGVNGATIRSGRFVQGDSAIVVSGSQNVTIENARISGLGGDGIVVTGSTGVRIRRNRIQSMGGAPILLHRGTSSTVVEHNQITGNKGMSNVAAGIVISDREVDIAADPRAIYGSDGYWVVSQPMMNRIHPPHDNLIAWNYVAQNLSSGIYADGGVRNILFGNTIENNAKEGICLDNGSAANVLTANSIRRNGNRWGQSDDVLRKDSAAEAGRLPDGTAAQKVPGVSIDNALYNLVFANDISFNYGGGIKLVRTAFFNLLGLNNLLMNNQGASPAFHFFGIELGAAPADSMADDLDFMPSRGNIVFSNSIRGNHYSGIYLGAGSDLNDIFDNVIMNALQWGLESASPMDNLSLNNLTNLPSRNIGSGVDPMLLTIGAPQITP